MTAAFDRGWIASLVLLAECTQTNAQVNDPRLARLMDDRQAIWQAWFTNDRSRLEQLLPNNVIAINGGDTTWQDRSAVLAGAAAFARSGRKLVSLTFPKTEKQVFGDVAILYSTYVAELEQQGKTSVQRGRAFGGLRLAKRRVAKRQLAPGRRVLTGRNSARVFLLSAGNN